VQSIVASWLVDWKLKLATFRMHPSASGNSSTPRRHDNTGIEFWSIRCQFLHDLIAGKIK
jgi:hypothetical protein